MGETMTYDLLTSTQALREAVAYYREQGLIMQASVVGLFNSHHKLLTEEVLARAEAVEFVSGGKWVHARFRIAQWLRPTVFELLSEQERTKGNGEP